MQRFVLRENIKLFERRLALAATFDTRQRLRHMLTDVRRELTLLDAQLEGVSRGAHDDDEPLAEARASALADFRREFAKSPKFAALIDPRPGLPFAEINPAYAAAARRPREALIDHPIFSMFPDDPSDALAEAMFVLFRSMRQVAASRRQVVMPTHRYDVAGIERYWANLCDPVLDAEGRLLFIRLLTYEATR